MIKKSNINFTIDRSKKEGVQDMNNEIFPSHFLGLICGKPGSGKTSLLKFIMQEPNLLFKKFDYVFILSPSFVEYKLFFLPPSNYTNQLDFDWIKFQIAKINETQSQTYTNVLFIFDDILSDLHKNYRAKEVLDFIFNRRHLLKNGMISVLITSQKYNYIPTAIRSALTLLIAFKLNNIDWKYIEDEIIFSDTPLSDVLNFVFKDNPFNFIGYRVDTNEYFKNFDKIINID